MMRRLRMVPDGQHKRAYIRRASPVLCVGYQPVPPFGFFPEQSFTSFLLCAFSRGARGLVPASFSFGEPLVMPQRPRTVLELTEDEEVNDDIVQSALQGLGLGVVPL
jgi:hypothetical protein